MHIQQMTVELFLNTNTNDTRNSLHRLHNAAEKLCELSPPWMGPQTIKEPITVTTTT